MIKICYIPFCFSAYDLNSTSTGIECPMSENGNITEVRRAICQITLNFSDVFSF